MSSFSSGTAMLTVLNVAFPLARVGPGAVGGAEQVLAQIDRALVAAGQRSIVIAPEGSACAGALVPLPAPPERLDRDAWIRAHEAVRAALARTVAAGRVDVVHLHGVDFARYLPAPGPPVLVTLHLPASHYEAEALRPARPRTYLHCVSASQRALFPRGIPLLDDVPNGVDLDRLRPVGRKRGFAVALGRVCEEKGLHLALDAAERAGAALLLAGMVHPFPEHVAYFEQVLRPRLRGRRRFLGPVHGEAKARLLSAARCLLVTSLVPETSSLVAAEALACGTPVVALRRGALPEIVDHGRTGFLVDSVEELAEALAAAGSLSPLACRREAERRLDARTTSARYLELYARIAQGVAGPAARIDAS